MSPPDVPAIPGINDDVYLPFEIARAAGVPLEQVVAAVGGHDVFVRYGPAVRLGRRLAGLATPEGLRPRPLFTAFYASPPPVHGGNRLPFVVTGAFHACLIAAAVALAAAGRISSLPSPRPPAPSLQPSLVFVAEAGPGGGGGG